MCLGHKAKIRNPNFPCGRFRELAHPRTILYHIHPLGDVIRSVFPSRFTRPKAHRIRRLERTLLVMAGDARPWNPKEWEKHVQLLLKKRYAHPPGTYQEVPDTVKGDCGVEGFAKDGTAYQCYAAQQWVSPEDLLKKQKNKITVDIAKFIKNEDELLKLFGDVKIRQWNLVVPYWTNKDLKKHANKKASEVQKEHLKHAAKDFSVSILTADDFAVEVRLLAQLDLYQFDATAPPVPPSDLAAWMASQPNLNLVANLTRKAGLIGANKSSHLREKFQARIVAQYIGGSIVLGRLEQELPEVYGRVIEYKVAREADLEAESYSTTKVPAEFFQSTLQDYREELRGVPGISPRAADTLAREAVSDWLLNCPMDFD